MAVSTFDTIFLAPEDDFGFCIAHIDSTLNENIPLYVPSIMSYIERGTPRITKEILKKSNIYINAKDIDVTSNTTVSTRNYIVPTLEKAGSLSTFSEREDGIIPAGTRLPIHFPFGSVREIIL